MTTIEQAKAVEQRLRESPIATVTGSFEVADAIASLITELEEAQKDAEREIERLRDSNSMLDAALIASRTAALEKQA